MKYLIAISCIIPLACGYIIGKSRSSSVKENQSASKAETRYDRSSARETSTRGNGDNALLDSILGGRPISEIPATDLAAIFIKLSKFDPDGDDFSTAKQFYQFQFLLSKLSPADLANIATALSSDPETKNSDELLEIISTLAAKDPDRALDWISTQEGGSKFHQAIILTIALSDPQKASSLLSSAITDGKIVKGDLQPLVDHLAHATAKLGADSFLGFLDSLPKEFQTSLITGKTTYNPEDGPITIYTTSTPNVPEHDRIKFLDQLHQRIQDGRLSGIEIENVFSQALTTNKDGATEWLKKLPENEQKNHLRTEAAKSLYLIGDKESAAEWMKEAIAASPGREKEIIISAIHDLQYHDGHKSASFLANLLPPEGERFTAEYLSNSIEYSPRGITAYSGLLSDPNEKSIYIANSLKEISKPSPSGYFQINSDGLDSLSRYIADMGLTGQNATRVNEAIEAAKKQLPLVDRTPISNKRVSLKIDNMIFNR